MPAATVKTAGDRENPVSFVFLAKESGTHVRKRIFTQKTDKIFEKKRRKFARFVLQFSDAQRIIKSCGEVWWMRPVLGADG
ncbi:MAG: hypothetical protein ACI3XY_01700 [Butyricicoccaceae bacterium]